jgi:hypothetical protein
LIGVFAGKVQVFRQRRIRFQISEVGGQKSAPPPAKKTAGQIEKETDVRRSICLLFNPGPAIEAASLIIKKIVPFWPSFIQD